MNPVREMHAVSHDISLQHQLVLADGRRLTALQVQQELLARADRHCAGADSLTREVLELWGEVLAALEADPSTCADRIDWVAKLALLEGFRERDGLAWSSPRLQLIDLQYGDLRTERGLAARLEQRGRLRRMFPDEQVHAAMTAPPTDTRAYFRGECMRRYPEAVAAASWDSVVFDLPGRDALLRVPMLEPRRGTREHVGDLLERAPDAEALVAGLMRDAG